MDIVQRTREASACVQDKAYRPLFKELADEITRLKDALLQIVEMRLNEEVDDPAGEAFKIADGALRGIRRNRSGKR